jgi:hypothetical protein
LQRGYGGTISLCCGGLKLRFRKPFFSNEKAPACHIARHSDSRHDCPLIAISGI